MSIDFQLIYDLDMSYWKGNFQLHNNHSYQARKGIIALPVETGLQVKSGDFFNGANQLMYISEDRLEVVVLTRCFTPFEALQKK